VRSFLSVTKFAGKRVWGEAWVEEWVGSTSDSFDFDIGDIVNKTATVWETLVVTTNNAERVWVGSWFDAHVETEHFRWNNIFGVGWSGKSWDTGEEDCGKIIARGWWYINTIQRFEKTTEFRIFKVFNELGFLKWLGVVPVIFLFQWDDHFIYEW
jgi:hypothetical protein